MKNQKVIRLVIIFCGISFCVCNPSFATPVYWSENEHYYDIVDGSRNWFETREDAESKIHLGLLGHLATITSQAENDFIVNTFFDPDNPIYHYLGGFQPEGSPEPAGNWQWVTGEVWDFTNWAYKQPDNGFKNDEQGPEGNILEIYFTTGGIGSSHAKWNDENAYREGSFWGSYIIEYEVSEHTTLTMEVSPSGIGIGIDTITPSVGAHPYYIGKVADINVDANRFVSCPDVYTFDHWEGNVDNVSSSNTTVLMNDNQTVTAVFVPTRQCGDECHLYPIGDFDQNCYVNWADFSIFASHWLEGGCTDPDWCGGADLNQAGEVTWGDFSIFADHWLECTAPECDQRQLSLCSV